MSAQPVEPTAEDEAALQAFEDVERRRTSGLPDPAVPLDEVRRRLGLT
jgi:hypothetical protein